MYFLVFSEVETTAKENVKTFRSVNIRIMQHSNTNKEYMESWEAGEIADNIKQEKQNELENKALSMGFETCEAEIPDKIDVCLMPDEIKRTLAEWAETKQMKYYMIVHDKDVNPKTGLPVPVHYHMVIKFANPTKKSDILKKFPVGYIEKTGSFKASVQYLLHKNNPEKFGYDVIDLFTNDPDLTWIDVQSKSQTDVELTRLIKQIADGTIREYQSVEIDPVLYANKRTVIDSAFKQAYKRIALEKRSSFIRTYFVTGPSGVGKSALCEDLAKKLGGGHFCRSSASNDPMQDYEGEPVLILDDTGADSFKYRDFLKLLDPYYRSSAKSRYRNKQFLGDYILIPSRKGLSHFYQQVDGDEFELSRRIFRLVKVSPDWIDFYAFDLEKRSFYPVERWANYIYAKFVNSQPEKLLDDPVSMELHALDLPCYELVDWDKGISQDPKPDYFLDSVPKSQNLIKCDAVKDISSKEVN